AARNEIAQTGLNASIPNSTPPHPGRPRTIKAQPHINRARVSGLFCARSIAPRHPGNRSSKAVAADHHQRPLVRYLTPAPVTKTGPSITPGAPREGWWGWEIGESGALTNAGPGG